MFVGCFDLEAAEAVVDLEGCSECVSVADVLGDLSDRSLGEVALESNSKARDYRLLFSIREFAREGLSRSASAERETFIRHARFYAERLEVITPAFLERGRRGIDTDFSAQFDEILRAHSFLLTAGEDQVEVAARIGIKAARLATLRGPMVWAKKTLEDILMDTRNLSPEVRSEGLICLSPRPPSRRPGSGFFHHCDRAYRRIDRGGGGRNFA